MNVTTQELIIRITLNEARTLYYSIRRGLEHSIRTNWRNYPNAFESSEADNIGFLRALGPYVGFSEEDIVGLKKTLAEEVDKAAKAVKEIAK